MNRMTDMPTTSASRSTSNRDGGIPKTGPENLPVRTRPNSALQGYPAPFFIPAIRRSVDENEWTAGFDGVI
jgi:hypothetical protein